ncbi:MAG: type I phosphomannose isomerase catalytic subunit [Paeniclostridium sordellii]|nr:type I phosphomannose isomerase catalytic subunit [Paeniclostridium sordellii]
MGHILKLDPFYSEKIWGYENWNLSTHKNGHCIINSSQDTLISKLGKELPILIKIIQANDTLSVQVHPDDAYASIHENDIGKTECWYILEAKEGASLICGIKEGLDKKTFSKIIEEGNIEKYLKKIDVKPGDMIYIPSGTVHAIQGGLKLIEVQQSSDITYRVYDWGRDREVHIEKSLDVIDYNGVNKCGKIDNFTKLETQYFTVEKICVSDKYEDIVKHDFHSYTVINGSGYICSNDNKVNLSKEETIYIPNGISYSIYGDIELIKSYV